MDGGNQDYKSCLCMDISNPISPKATQKTHCSKEKILAPGHKAEQNLEACARDWFLQKGEIYFY